MATAKANKRAAGKAATKTATKRAARPKPTPAAAQPAEAGRVGPIVQCGDAVEFFVTYGETWDPSDGYRGTVLECFQFRLESGLTQYCAIIRERSSGEIVPILLGEDLKVLTDGHGRKFELQASPAAARSAAVELRVGGMESVLGEMQNRAPDMVTGIRSIVRPYATGEDNKQCGLTHTSATAIDYLCAGLEEALTEWTAELSKDMERLAATLRGEPADQGDMNADGYHLPRAGSRVEFVLPTETEVRTGRVLEVSTFAVLVQQDGGQKRFTVPLGDTLRLLTPPAADGDQEGEGKGN